MNRRSRTNVVMRCLVLGVLGTALVLLAMGVFQPLWPGWAGGRSFDPVRVLDEQPPITEFTVHDREAADDAVEDAELVIGVAVNGEARAYPINMLTGPQREIINDTLGSTPIAATW